MDENASGNRNGIEHRHVRDFIKDLI
jgi:hypothetical protein